MPPKPLSAVIPKFKLNYARAEFTFAISMTSICYADRLARRNAVAKFSCNPGDLTDHPGLPARSKFDPPPSPIGSSCAGGPTRLASARTKRHTVRVKLALSCANVALERLAWHCSHGARVSSTSHGPRGRVSVAQMAICETQSQVLETEPSDETRVDWHAGLNQLATV